MIIIWLVLVVSSYYNNENEIMFKNSRSIILEALL